MFIPKRYGQSSISTCPFCGAQAFAKNEQNIPCCTKHKHIRMPDVKCVCGGWLDQRESKFGVFYTCMKCGPISFNKMMELNADRIRESMLPKKPEPKLVQSFADNGAKKKLMTIQERVREKLKRGEPLTPDELEFL